MKFNLQLRVRFENNDEQILGMAVKDPQDAIDNFNYVMSRQGTYCVDCGDELISINTANINSVTFKILEM